MNIWIPDAHVIIFIHSRVWCVELYCRTHTHTHATQGSVLSLYGVFYYIMDVLFNSTLSHHQFSLHMPKIAHESQHERKKHQRKCFITFLPHWTLWTLLQQRMRNVGSAVTSRRSRILMSSPSPVMVSIAPVHIQGRVHRDASLMIKQITGFM